MHVVVVGCGRVGSGLAQQLTGAGHTVGIVDRRAEAFEKLPEGFDGIRVVGVGFDRDRLVAAGIERADALAAVTSGDNSNILIARVAREAFGIERVAARIYDPKRAVIYERLGIPTIATVQWTTERVLRRLVPDAGAPAWIDPTAAISLVERTIPAHWAGKPLGAIEGLGRDGAGARVVSLSRLGQASIADPGQALQDGDTLWVAVPTADITSFDDALTLVPTAGGHH